MVHLIYFGVAGVLAISFETASRVPLDSMSTGLVVASDSGHLPHVFAGRDVLEP